MKLDQTLLLCYKDYVKIEVIHRTGNYRANYYIRAEFKMLPLFHGRHANGCGKGMCNNFTFFPPHKCSSSCPQIGHQFRFGDSEEFLFLD
ncbi:MAG: hypothetical protein ACTSRE_03290 [Promethearchaeota archaeon]